MSAIPRVLLVDDDAAVCRAVEFRLRGSAELTACGNAVGAVEAVRGGQFDAALVDVNLGPGMSGTQLISDLREADPDLAAIIFTAHANYETALDSLGVHSFDFIPKSLRDDRTFCDKIGQAVQRTREQRGRSRRVADATRLQSALAEAVVSNELEVTTGDIQRGLLAESLSSFSSLLGQVELLDLYLAKLKSSTSGLEDASKLSEDTVAELQDYVGKLRDYFTEPQRATNSVNDAIFHAARVVQAAAHQAGDSLRVERGALNPDQAFTGDSRALLRAIVIILRLIAKGAPREAALTVRPTVLFHPLADLNALRTRGHAVILHTPNFRKDDRMAVAVDISGPRGGMTAERISNLFSTHQPALSEASPWSAVAMVAKLDGALAVELRPGSLICYRIIIKV